MSWPWRPNTWEKGLRPQVSISSMAELLRERRGPSSSLERQRERERERECTVGQPPSVETVGCCSGPILSSHLLSTANLPLKPPHDLSSAFPCRLPADCRSVLCVVASDAVRAAAAPELMGDLCWVAFSSLVSAPELLQMERARQTQHEQSKREREGERVMRRRSLLQRGDGLSPLTKVRREKTVWNPF